MMENCAEENTLVLPNWCSVGDSTLASALRYHQGYGVLRSEEEGGVGSLREAARHGWGRSLLARLI